MKLVLLASVCVYLNFAAAAYPSTYPFENESFVPVDTPPGSNGADVEPNLTYDPDTDTGGYIYYYYARAAFDLTEADWESPTVLGEDWSGPWNPSGSGAIRYMLVNQFGASADLPGSVWNCTAAGTVFSDADYTGVINGQTICAANDCCAGLIGLPKFSTDQLNWHDLMTDRLSAAMCGELEEELYCIIVGGDFQTNCFDYYLSPSDRLYTFICNDSYSQFYLNCPVFQQAYVPVYVKSEPPSYYSSISMEEMISSDAQFYCGDRVCHPYSYYHPGSAGGGGGDSSATSGSSSATDASASASEASSASLVVGTFAVLFLCF